MPQVPITQWIDTWGKPYDRVKITPWEAKY